MALNFESGCNNDTAYKNIRKESEFLENANMAYEKISIARIHELDCGKFCRVPYLFYE